MRKQKSNLSENEQNARVSQILGMDLDTLQQQNQEDQINLLLTAVLTLTNNLHRNLNLKKIHQQIISSPKKTQSTNIQITPDEHVQTSIQRQTRSPPQIQLFPTTISKHVIEPHPDAIMPNPLIPEILHRRLVPLRSTYLNQLIFITSEQKQHITDFFPVYFQSHTRKYLFILTPNP